MLRVWQTLSSKAQGIITATSIIGFMVQGITPDGFLMIVTLGGWWNHTLPSQRVLVHTRDGRRIPGQIGTKPPHLLPEAQRRQVMDNESLFIDIGASCADGRIHFISVCRKGEKENAEYEEKTEITFHVQPSPTSSVREPKR